MAYLYFERTGFQLLTKHYSVPAVTGGNRAEITCVLCITYIALETARLKVKTTKQTGRSSTRRFIFTSFVVVVFYFFVFVFV